MYNPEYCARPHVVALNKVDMPDAADLREELAAEIGIMAQRIQVRKRSLRCCLGAVCALHQLSRALECQKATGNCCEVLLA